MDNLVIAPYVGVGRVKFGMTPDQVAATWGPPESTGKTHLGGRVDFYADLNVGYTLDAIPTVNHVGGGRTLLQVEIATIKLFVEEPIAVIKRLFLLDASAGTYLGFLVFLELGISLTGFHDDDEDQRAFAAFERGSWDKRIMKLKKIDIGALE